MVQATASDGGIAVRFDGTAAMLGFWWAKPICQRARQRACVSLPNQRCVVFVPSTLNSRDSVVFQARKRYTVITGSILAAIAFLTG